MPAAAEADSAAYSSVSFVGDRLYYVYSVYKEGEKSSGWYYVDAVNPEAGPMAVLDLTQYETWGEDLVTGVAKAVRCGEDGIVLLLRTQPPVSRDVSEEEYARQKRETTYSVKKLAADGMEVFDIDITEYLYIGMGSMADLQIFTDKEGAIYVSDNTSYVWVFDKEENHTADIALPGMQGLAVAVVEFNKTSEHHKIEIKMYETYEAKDARVLLYNDILTGNAPDMFVAADSIRQVISSI